MPISVNLAVTTWFPLEFNIHAWKLFPSAIIFIVIAFNKNHTGNNTLIMNHNSRNYSATIQGMRHSHSQVGKHVNGHTSASHISLNSILHRGRASDVMDQLMEATRTPENPDHQILTFCTWATCCKCAQQHRILFSLWRIYIVLNFTMTPVKTLFTMTCKDAAQLTQNSDSCPVVPNKITSSSENTVISSVHNCCQNPKSPARNINSWNTKCRYFLNLLIFITLTLKD